MWKVDEYCMARRVLMAEVGGGRVRGRPRLGWMDGVKVALGNRGTTVEAARPCASDWKEWRALARMQLNKFHAAIFAWHCVRSDLIMRAHMITHMITTSRALVVILWRGEGCRHMIRLG